MFTKPKFIRFSLRSLRSHDVCYTPIVSGKRLDVVEYLLGQHAAVDEPDEVTQLNRRSDLRRLHILAKALDADTAIPPFFYLLVWMDPSPYCRYVDQDTLALPVPASKNRRCHSPINFNILFLTALLASVGHPEIVNLLLDKKANVNSRTESGTTPLYGEILQLGLIEETYVEPVSCFGTSSRF